jgi:transposase
MTIPCTYIGIDLSKNVLDIFDPRDGTYSRHANDAPTLCQLAKGWRGADIFICFESSGPCEGDLGDFLHREGIPFARLNPARVRHFANSMGWLAKTDALDAKVISAYAAASQPRPDVPLNEAQKRLNILSLRRDQIVAMRAQEKNHLAAARDADMIVNIERHIDFLNEEVKALDKAIIAAAHEDEKIAQDYAILRSIPGIGTVTAGVVLALLPEAGQLDSKGIATLAGLAPMNRDSGKKSGTRKIGGGRRRVRKALYMAARGLLHSKKQNPLKDFYQKLQQKGKPFKVAIIALARKLLTILNAMLKTRTLYQPK